MALYRKKSVIVEAFKWTGDQNQTEDPEWIVEAIRKGIVTFAPAGGIGTTFVYIQTPEGIMSAAPGSYIIKGIKGEIYPCQPDIFEQTYELVKEKKCRIL